jgi:tRNA A37 threonylcarbamoyladenosine dehydratase
MYTGNPDYVIDAIDNIETKVDLIQYCYEHKLPVMASMGAGAKADPTRIQIADVSNTFGKAVVLN